MGNAIRDFIPEGDEATPAELARRHQGRIIRTGANHTDFIPDPNDPTIPPKRRTPEEKRDAAMNAAIARAQWASRNEFAVAQLRLKEWTPAQAVASIETMPVAAMEMYIAAETLGARRHDIISLFPPIDQSVVDRYRSEQAEQSVPVEEPAPQEVPAVKAEEVAPVQEEVPTQDETFLCIECDKVCANLAGLQAHIRAKHPQAGGAE